MLLEGRHVLGAISIGLGATLGIDLWALLLRRAFHVPSLNFCFLGRWLLHMPGGRITHASIAAAAPKRYECATGWVSHYLIGTGLALVFVLIVSGGWLERPTLGPALGFGMVTVLMPFLILQPSFGLGIAAGKSPSPARARLKSLMTHTVFGAGLYLWASLLCRSGIFS
jgi:hypothetical protein